MPVITYQVIKEVKMSITENDLKSLSEKGKQYLRFILTHGKFMTEKELLLAKKTTKKEKRVIVRQILGRG